MDTPFKRKAVPTHRIPLICKWQRAYTITRVMQTHVKTTGSILANKNCFYSVK